MLSLILSFTTIFALIMVIVFKPVVSIRNKDIQTFWMIPVIGVIALIIANEVKVSQVSEILFVNSAINPIKILILFISISFLSIVLDEAGFFKKCASFAVKHTSGSQKALFFSISLVVSVLTVFTSNDIVILTFTPFICYFAKNAKISPIPYLIAEFIFANTWSMMLIIGNPTNIYLATSFNIDFWNYFSIMVLPSIVTGLSAFGILYLMFRKSLNKPIESDEAFLEEVKVNKNVAIVAGIHLACCTILLAVSSYIGFEMWLVCLAFSISLMIFLIIYSFCKKENVIMNSIKRLPFNLIPFMISMFIIVAALNQTGLMKNIATAFDGIETSGAITVYVHGLSSFLSCNVLNNIPMSVMYEKIISSSNGIFMQEKIYSSIAASNIGAYLTPVGALAGIMWMGILKKMGIKFGFKEFLK